MEDSLFGKPARNFAPRTIWTGDNLDILRGINSETVDLIYLDPPFNSNRTYSAPIGSKAAGAAFEDTWTLDKEDVAWMGLIADQHPAIHDVIVAAGSAHGTGMQSYLRMMAVRLLEMRRVLTPTGSIYLHCDDTADAYLRLLMDAVFGQRGFRNSLCWRRATAHSDGRRYGRNTDTILFYAKSAKGFTWKPGAASTPKTVDQVTKLYPSKDRRGNFRSADLTAAEIRYGESGKPWQGFDPTEHGVHWRAPLTGTYAVWIEQNVIANYRAIKGVHERLDALLAEGMIILPTDKRKWPGLKRYADSDIGISPQALILNPTGFTNYTAGKEYVGYPTQKPLALLDRIIRASSNPGDVVLDPFCGCATACVAADNLQREWVGIDISPMAVELVHRRLRDTLGELYHAGMVTARTDIPQRTDIEAPINYRQNRHVLFGEQEGKCNGCQMEFPFKMFEVDHMVPRRRGGTDHKSNLQLLCSPCNRIKGDRPMEYLMARLAEYARPA